MSVQEPLIELLHSEPPSHGTALVRRPGRPSLRLIQTHLAHSPRSAYVAWAIFGILAGVVMALAGAVVALVCLLLNRPAEKAVPASAAPVAATASSCAATRGIRGGVGR